MDDLERVLAQSAPALGTHGTPDGMGADALEDETPRLVLEDVCLPCRLGFCAECDLFWEALDRFTSYDEQCCCGGDFSIDDALIEAERRKVGADLFVEEPGYVLGLPPVEEAELEFPAYWGTFKGKKPLEEYVDAKSAGRKIAAKTAPIEPGMICEWAWLAKAGGGVVPIIGCPGRPASDRHHGPDKNTMRNELGTNLHRICDWCHNQWHAKNDPFYGPRAERPDGTVAAEVPFLPVPGVPVLEHDGITRATDEEVYLEDGARRVEARRHGANI